MEPIGDEQSWRIGGLEMDIHPLEMVDLEQSKNLNVKLIHSMWAGLSLPKKHDWTRRGPRPIVRLG